MRDRCLLVIPGPPVGKGRPRATTISGRPRMYTPPKTAAYERAVSTAAAAAWSTREPIAGPVRLDVLAIFPRPQRLRRKRDPRGLVYCPGGRVDLDNVIKAIGDGLQSCGRVFVNDAQICRVEAVKAFAEIDVEPRCVVAVSPLVPLQGLDAWIFMMTEGERLA